jgi:hypothetical protein
VYPNRQSVAACKNRFRSLSLEQKKDDAYIAKLPKSGTENGATIFSLSGANTIGLKLDTAGQWTTVSYPRTPFLRAPPPLVQETVYNVFAAWFIKYKSEIEKAAKSADGEIWIGGHSFGGPLAYFLGEHLVSEFGIPKSKIIVVTVGSIRPGNRHFRDVVTSALEPKNLYRVAKGKDPSTRFPVTNELFAHIPTEIFIDGDSTYYCAGRTLDGEDANCNRKASSGGRILSALFATDHLHNTAFAGVDFRCRLFTIKKG